MHGMQRIRCLVGCRIVSSLWHGFIGMCIVVLSWGEKADSVSSPVSCLEGELLKV